jgi:predicted PurR-regulated permease PerM
VPSKKAILAILIVMAIITGVAIGVSVLWQSLTGSFKEVENAIATYINALNSYNATEAWILMSPTLRGETTYSEFEEFVQDLESKQWRAQIKSISSRSIETKNGRTTATFILMAEITETDPIAGTQTYTEEWTFNLVKIEGEWKINAWLYQ